MYFRRVYRLIQHKKIAITYELIYFFEDIKEHGTVENKKDREKTSLQMGKGQFFSKAGITNGII